MRKLVIIPAFNEANDISNVVKNVSSVAPDADILVIDDNSIDNTAENAGKAGAIVVSHPTNFGYGVALQTGYKYAYKYKYDMVIQLDGDGQHHPRYIPSMIKMLDTKKADIIIGSRFKKNSGYKVPLARTIGMSLFGFLATIITRKRISDPTSGYQVIKSNVLPFLISDKFPCDFPDADLLIMYHYNGFAVREFPMEMGPGNKISMHYGFRRNLYYVFKMCLSILLTVIRERPKRRK